MKLDPRTITQFAVIAEERSFTKAAERLRVAQPWLSARLRKLEDQIGFPLFIRSTRNVTLTERGEAFLKAACNVYASVAAAEALAAQLRRRDERRLRLGTPPYSNQIAQRRNLIDRFASVYPAVSVELDVGWTPTLIERVRSGDLDIAFALGSVEDPDLEVNMLCRIGVEMMMSQFDPLATRSILSPADFKDRAIAVFTRALHPNLFDELFAPLANSGAELIQVPEMSAAILAQVQGPRRLIAFQFTFSEATTDEAIASRPLEMKQKVPFSLLRRRGTATPLAQSFWDLAL